MQVRIQEKDSVTENICRLVPQACKIGLNLWMASGFTFFQASNCSRMIFLKLEISKNTAKMNQWHEAWVYFQGGKETHLVHPAGKHVLCYMFYVDILVFTAWIVAGCVVQLGRKIAGLPCITEKPSTWIYSRAAGAPAPVQLLSSWQNTSEIIALHRKFC
jgi:hypothetical protein